jgi:hypothetical protein
MAPSLPSHTFPDAANAPRSRCQLIGRGEPRALQRRFTAYVTSISPRQFPYAYLDSIGTRAEDAVYKRLRLKLTAAYRQLHNEMHRRGHFHGHTPLTDHSPQRP